MPMRQFAISSAVLALALIATACEAVPQVLHPGSRIWIIPVQNTSGRPALVAVAEDRSPMGKLVGTAQPASIPAGATVDVTFTVPPEGKDWAIFVNPSPTLGSLIGARDVPPGVTGRLPLTIIINEQGEPSVEVPGEPGWFGN